MVTPSGFRPADVLIGQEAVAELLEHDSPDTEGVILDVEDLAVLPGLVALHPIGLEGAGGGGIVAASRECRTFEIPRGDVVSRMEETQPFSGSRS